MRIPVVIGIAWTLSCCAPLPPAERVRRDASDQANVHCDGYATASRTPLGTAKDVAEIIRAVKLRTGQNIVGDIRWLSGDKALVPLDHGCCEVTRTGSNQWIVTGFPGIIGLT